jgi:DNA-binding LacI/PurR family transcriptional regulator
VSDTAKAPAPQDPGVPVRAARSVPNIRDVAAAAGVSHQTVSRVLNGSPRVRPATRAQVLAQIQAMNYRPNQAARTLSSGRARRVTVVTANTTLYGPARTLQGIEEAARGSGFGVGVLVVESASQAAVGAVVDYTADPTTGAVIVIAFDEAGERVLHSVPPGVPVVAAIEPALAVPPGVPHVWLDDRAAGIEATNLLLSLGHRTVHHIPLPSAERSHGRTEGWRAALSAAGAPIPRLPAPGWDAPAGYRAGRALAGNRRVTAILCGNDDLATGVRRALHEAGRAVPREVSLVGFDDAPSSAYAVPALTTVAMDFVALGRACFEAASAALLGGPIPSARLPTPRVVLRESVAPPPSSSPPRP